MNVKSMTGYGKAEKIAGNNKITIEIRSLNSKQSDITLKTAPLYRSVEMELRKLVSASAIRGKMDVNLTRESLNGNTNAVFNAGAFKSYYKTVSETARELGLDIDSQDFITSILRLPEVVISNNEELTEQEIEAVLDCCSEALTALDLFRSKEGEVLIADILNRISLIEEKLLSIEPYEKSRLEKVKLSIESGLSKLDFEVDKNRFEQELIYYIERLDITEEKVRLGQHCSFFRQTCEKEDLPGRKLGFLAQEIGREINTIGSKAGEADIQKIVVEMKDELEKIKEQLLNIL